MMKVLFCSPISLDKRLGAAKALIELAEALEDIGWKVDIVSPSDIFPTKVSYSNPNLKGDYAKALRDYLYLNASQYHVVEYDHLYLPYPRAEFCTSTLLVARSQLLAHHFCKIKPPPIKNWKMQIRSLLKDKADQHVARKNLIKAQTTLDEADIAIVLNQVDKQELVRNGISANKIFVVPNGLNSKLRLMFDSVNSSPFSSQPIISFVGTFDSRKGAADFPAIVQVICQEFPTASFRLIGTAGLYRTIDQVLAHFPKKLRCRIEVIPTFHPDKLPELLASCSVGIFPSYIEGFGIGILEMLAAGIPVIAYDSPGPQMMLPSEYLVQAGDVKGMSQKVVDLLNNHEKLVSAKRWSKKRSKHFCWQQIAYQTSEIYIEHWQKKQTPT